MIEFKNINCIRDGDYILKDINLKINKNENWLVLGPNGSGKSTLFSLLKAYTIASAGEIEVFGKSFGFDNWNCVKEKIRLVSSTMDKFKDVLYKESVYEIVLSGLKNKIGIYEKESEDEKNLVENFLRDFDFYYMKDKKYKVLSAGEKQKVLILRSLIARPEILVLDEPCASLDLYQKEKILNFIEDIKTNLIYISHDISEILPTITHVVLIKDGRIFKKGKREEVLTDKNLSELYGLNLNIEFPRDERPIIHVLRGEGKWKLKARRLF